MQIKIFTDNNVSTLEQDVNEFISKNKIYVSDIKVMENYIDESYYMTITILYEHPNHQLYSLGDIHNMAKNVLLEELKEIYKEDELIYELAEKNYSKLKEKYDKLINNK